MNTRNLLMCLWVLLFSSGVQAVEFKIATIAPDGTRWMTEMRAATDMIKERTEGRVTFKFYPGGVMGNDQSVLRKIRIGQLHGAAFTGGGLAPVYDNILIYGLPLLFGSLEEVDYVRERMDPIFEKGMEEAGMVNFGFAEGGFARLMSRTAITESVQLKNEKSWVPEGDKIAYSALDALGISPVSLPVTDVLTGLQTGLITTVASSELGAVAFQWHTRIKYVTDVPISYLLGIFAIDKRAFMRATPEDQAIIREVMGDVFDRLNVINRNDNAAARQALLEQGIEFVEPSEATVAEWRAITAKVIDENGANGVYDMNLVNQIRELIHEFRNQQP